MNILLLNRIGFCNGVNNSYLKLINILKNSKMKVYVLGQLIHNTFIIDKLKKLGTSFLPEDNDKRLLFIKNNPNNLYIITAHGISPKIKDYLIKNNISYYDLTCPYVDKIHNIINSYINKKYDVIFIGKKNHAETLGVMGISKNIYLIENIKDINKLDIRNKKIVITNQTTLSDYKIKNIKIELLKKYPFSKLIEGVCVETTLRQNELINKINKCDLCLIVGDKKSNNTNELYKIALKYKKSYLIESKKDIKKDWFKNVSTCLIAGGASTPIYLINDIVDFLKKL